MNHPSYTYRRNKGRQTAKIRLFCLCGAALVCLCALCGILQPNDPPQETQTTSAAAPDTLSNYLRETQPTTPSPPPETHASLPSNRGTAPSDPWNLLLVNRWNPVPEGYSTQLIQLKNGHAIDCRVYPDLQDMMDAMRAAGLSPLICSSYRTQQKQQELFTNKVARLLASGYSRAAALAEAEKWVALPGTSEHQTGLAVDIVDINNQALDETQEDTPVQIWLMEHSWEYGFILRYPTGKSDITGIYYEPWHYRYVGKEPAKAIYESNLCLEEYLAKRKSG